MGRKIKRAEGKENSKNALKSNRNHPETTPKKKKKEKRKRKRKRKRKIKRKRKRKERKEKGEKKRKEKKRKRKRSNKMNGQRNKQNKPQRAAHGSDSNLRQQRRPARTLPRLFFFFFPFTNEKDI
jgi:outer membrane biosynthesis protein TonB